METNTVSTPAVKNVAQPKASIHGNKGVAAGEFLIGIYTIGFGIYHLTIAEDAVLQYGGKIIAVGFWFILTACFAWSAKKHSSASCINICGTILASMASIAALGLVTLQSIICFVLFSICSTYDSCHASEQLFLHVVMFVMAAIEFILSIIHATYGCSCCEGSKDSLVGRNQAPIVMEAGATNYQVKYAPQAAYAPAYQMHHFDDVRSSSH